MGEGQRHELRDLHAILYFFGQSGFESACGVISVDSHVAPAESGSDENAMWRAEVVSKGMPFCHALSISNLLVSQDRIWQAEMVSEGMMFCHASSILDLLVSQDVMPPTEPMSEESSLPDVWSPTKVTFLMVGMIIVTAFSVMCMIAFELSNCNQHVKLC